MKKIVFLLTILVIFSVAVSAQGFYFDIGFDYGYWANSNDDYEINMYYDDGGSSHNTFDQWALGYGIKFGYGPFNTTPVYAIVGWENGIKGGVLYYPTPMVQLGLALGVSWLPCTNVIYYWNGEWIGDPGFGWSMTAAFDLGKKNSGCLIGLKYHGAYAGKIDNSKRAYENNYKDSATNGIDVFMKYAFRKKVNQENTRTPREPREKQPRAQPASREQAQPQVQAQEQPRPPVAGGIDGAINRVSQSLINDLPENTSLAVINISSNDGNVSAHVADELEFFLVSSRKFAIVDRNALEIIRSEQNFQMSGDVSDSTAVSIGEMLGANIVITGSITQSGANQRLSIRALDVRTARILAMAREEF